MYKNRYFSKTILNTLVNTVFIDMGIFLRYYFQFSLIFRMKVLIK
jgi:hypothetical protein